MKRFLILAVLLVFPFVSSVLWAHGGSEHILGTVTEATETHVVVKTSKGESVSIAFRANTTFQKDGIHVNDTRPQAGDRLIAEGSKDGERFVATEIRFSTPKKKQ